MLAPAAALAQSGQNGSIIGYVFDEGGMPLKGIKISATSPTQIGGAKVAYTNDEGSFRLPAAAAGQLRGAGLGAQAGDHHPQGRQGRHQRARPRSTSS